ncbi:hypothetical protein QNH32_05575 [Priestia flexa]|uniref:hypothetical protein n=1 Tax=Priestia flexa TaxID=86664 RepID=UPI0024C0494B|nr:hypothetical protein [Priestia flexa]WHX80072.1 hypothetical protein QNH32_05575 [Priestia flexa]
MRDIVRNHKAFEGFKTKPVEFVRNAMNEVAGGIRALQHQLNHGLVPAMSGVPNTPINTLSTRALMNTADETLSRVVGKGTGKSPSAFADRAKLEGHFDKHGKEFDGLYKNADEYLEGAKEVINNGIKVKYEYKGELRTGYVKFMGNNKNGKAKFEFVGTNNNGDITTYHTQSGKKIWKTINGENIPVINPAE